MCRLIGRVNKNLRGGIYYFICTTTKNWEGIVIPKSLLLIIEVWILKCTIFFISVLRWFQKIHSAFFGKVQFKALNIAIFFFLLEKKLHFKVHT